MHVAGHELGEAVGDGDDRLAEVVVGHAGGPPQGAGAGHGPTVRGGPRPQLRHAYKSCTVRRADATAAVRCRVREQLRTRPPTACAHPAQLGSCSSPRAWSLSRRSSGLVAAVPPSVLLAVARPDARHGAAPAGARAARRWRAGGALLSLLAGLVGVARRGRALGATQQGAAHRLGDRGGDRHGGERAGRSAPACSGCPASPPPRAATARLALDGLVIGGRAVVRRLGALRRARPGCSARCHPDGLPGDPGGHGERRARRRAHRDRRAPRAAAPRAARRWLGGGVTAVTVRRAGVRRRALPGRADAWR